jgi:hypothetical protein
MTVRTFKVVFTEGVDIPARSKFKFQLSEHGFNSYCLSPDKTVLSVEPDEGTTIRDFVLMLARLVADIDTIGMIEETITYEREYGQDF